MDLSIRKPANARPNFFNYHVEYGNNWNGLVGAVGTATVAENRNITTNRCNGATLNAELPKVIGHYIVQKEPGNKEYETMSMRVHNLENWQKNKASEIVRLWELVNRYKTIEKETQNLELALLKKGVVFSEEYFEQYRQNYQTHLDNMTSTSSNTALRPQTFRASEQEIYRPFMPVSDSTKTTANFAFPDLEIQPKFEANEDDMVKIGPNGTMISKYDLEAIKWSLPAVAITRKILVSVFSREILATHTLTGKPSPAFRNMNWPIKKQLDPLKVDDVVQFIVQNTELKQRQVRNVITIKCADEQKMSKQREKRKRLNDLKMQQQMDNMIFY